MDTVLQLIIYKGNYIFGSVIVTSSSAVRYDTYLKKNQIGQKKTVSSDYYKTFENTQIFRLNKKGYNAYFVSAYVVTLTKSNVYRKAALRSLVEFLHTRLSGEIQAQTIFVKLRTPRKQFLDYGWNERITQILLERREVDHAMSWLSTLGGAFSALGEEFQHCAQIAGKISVQQFQLALRLGDPLLIARCKLYAALSLIQQGHFRIAKHIVINIYKFAIDKKDIRLQNMCQGIWAKLKYCYKLRKQKKLLL